MNIDKVYEFARPGDIILTKGKGLLSNLICAGQSVQTPDHKPSRFSHVVMYIDSMTIAESTIDFDPYIPTGRRMDNGVQFNDLFSLRGKESGLLMCMPLTQEQRQTVINEATLLVGAGKRYDISGLVGSLLSFWLLDKVGLGRFNPLSTGLYCSAFIQECYDPIKIDFDPKHTSKNTSPEIMSQYQAEGLLSVALS